MKFLAVVALCLLSTITFAQTEVKLDFTWLSYENFQKLTPNEQAAVVAATRDSVVFFLDAAQDYNIRECVSDLSADELNSMLNAALLISPDDDVYQGSVAAGLMKLMITLCYVNSED